MWAECGGGPAQVVTMASVNGGPVAALDLLRTESTSATASREGGDQPIAHAHCDPRDARVARTPNSLHEEAEHKRRGEDERDPPHGPPHGEKVPSKRWPGGGAGLQCLQRSARAEERDSPIPPGHLVYMARTR